MTDTAKRHELSDLAKAIGERALELKYGRRVIYEVALDDIKRLAQELVTKAAAAPTTVETP